MPTPVSPKIRIRQRIEGIRSEVVDTPDITDHDTRSTEQTGRGRAYCPVREGSTDRDDDRGEGAADRVSHTKLRSGAMMGGARAAGQACRRGLLLIGEKARGTPSPTGRVSRRGGGSRTREGRATVGGNAIPLGRRESEVKVRAPQTRPTRAQGRIDLGRARGVVNHAGPPKRGEPAKAFTARGSTSRPP